MFALTDRAIFTSVLPNQPITCRSGKFSSNTVWWSTIRNTSFNIPIFCTILIVASYLGRLQCMNYSFPSPFSHTWKLSYQASFLIWLEGKPIFTKSTTWLFGQMGPSKVAKLFWGIMELYWCVRYNKKSSNFVTDAWAHEAFLLYSCVCMFWQETGDM